MIRAMVIVVAALVLGCSSSSGNGGTGGGGGGGGSGGSGGSCAGGPTSPNACLGPRRDNCNPCSKITDAQASAAVGGIALTHGTQNGDLCEWLENDAKGNPILAVDFNVGTDPGLFACDPANGFQTTPVSGVGDSACYWQAPLAYAPNYQWTLEFEKGCAVYITSVVAGPGAPPLTDAEEQADAKTLALDAVPNL